jgi:phenylacetate-CoA ligase
MSPLFQPDLESMSVRDRSGLQLERLDGLVRRLQAADSIYWREKLGAVDPDGLQAIEDITLLPFTVKAELRDSYPFGMLAVPLSETVRIHASSGTRGKPTVVAYTANDVAIFAEVNARSIAAAGAVTADVFHNAYGYGLFTGGLGLHYGAERLGVTVVPASGGNAGFQVQMLADLGAAGLASTPSFALLLAERAEADGLRDRINLRYGVFGAEPWSEAFRQKLEAAWEIDACDIYGLSEVMGPGVAMECAEGKGALHVFDDHFYPEVVDPATGEPVESGQEGELVLTTLTKEAFPVLRYRTGDITRFVDEACACGRTHRRIARFSGRSDDMLVIRGVNVFPSAIEAVLLDDHTLAGQYAIVIDRRRAMPELEVHCELVSAGDQSHREAIASRLRDRLGDRLRLRVKAFVGSPGTIPRQEIGKARRVFTRTKDEDPYPAPED